MLHFNGIDYAMIAIAGFVGTGFFIGYSRNIGNRLRRGYAFAMIGLFGLMASVVIYVVALHVLLPQVVLWGLPALSSVFIIGGGIVHYMVTFKLWFKNRRLVRAAKDGGSYSNVADVNELFNKSE